MMSMNLRDIYILNIKNVDCCCFVKEISKNKAIKLLQNTDWTEKNGAL